MELLIIKGGNKLKGEVKISGAKNSALPILFATLLTESPVTLFNVPNLKDIETTISIIEYLGKKVCRKENSLLITSVSSPPKEKGFVVAPYELIKKMRASFLVSGALLAQYKKVKVALPGGCAIGVRPVDIHISAFEKLGCKHYLEKGYEVFLRDTLHPATFTLRYPSVGATENIMILASYIPGETIIHNAACEPEIQDLSEFLKKLGVEIYNVGERTIHIIGKKKLKSSPVEHTIIPDRIETGTYITAAAITKGEIVIKNTCFEHLTSVIKKLVSTGLKIEQENSNIYVRWVKELKPQNIITKPYPGFPTDLQAQYMALMCVTKGKSVITETIFENRFLHVGELQRLGAKIFVNGNKAVVTGVDKLVGCEVMVSDLRAGAALVLAGLAAEGITKITHIYHLDRGYEQIEKKLSNLGAEVKRSDMYH